VAIQNIVAGGFYGKLGDMVGQRWRNIRTIRAHVIPFNPRTELQQANRAQFALATALAQEAYNINKGSPLWDTTRMGQFSAMVGTAKRRLQAGMSPAQALPLYPDGHVSDIVLSNMALNWGGWGSSVVVTCNSFQFTDTRRMEVIIQAQNEITGQPQFVMQEITVPAGSLFTFQFFTANTFSLPAGANIHAVTVDDAQFNGQSIELPVSLITQLSPPNLQFTLNFPPLVYNPEWHTLDFRLHNLPTPEYDPEMIEYMFWDLDGGYWENGNAATQFIGTDWLVQITIDDGYTDFRAGSHIIAGSFNITRPTALLSFSWVQFNFQYP